jgi:hypothetical protein
MNVTRTIVSSSFLALGALALIGCGPEAPSVRYSGNTAAAIRRDQVRVFRGTTPDRPFQELGTVEVSCPTAAQQSGFGQVSQVGGCTLDEAVGMAVDRAAESGAEGLFNVQSSAASNGNIVSLTAVAVKFTGPPKVAAPAPAVAPKKDPPEERLERLKGLADKGLITPEEYQRRREEILKEL